MESPHELNSYYQNMQPMLLPGGVIRPIPGRPSHGKGPPPIPGPKPTHHFLSKMGASQSMGELYMGQQQYDHDQMQYRKELSHVQRQLFPSSSAESSNNNNCEVYNVHDTTAAAMSGNRFAFNGQKGAPNGPISYGGAQFCNGYPRPTSNLNKPLRKLHVIKYFERTPFKCHIELVAPLEEVDYASHDQLELNCMGENGGPVGGTASSTMSDLHRQLLNIPMTSEGSHDSHNDSGYSTRLGFSAGPSPSLSGMT